MNDEFVTKLVTMIDSIEKELTLEDSIKEYEEIIRLLKFKKAIAEFILDGQQEELLEEEGEVE